MKRLSSSLMMLAALLAGGCASPASRIKHNPELFASFPAAVQEKVQAGRIELGFSHDMVMLALGSPDRLYSRATTNGVSDIWAYTRARYEADLVPLHTTYWYRDTRGRLRLGDDWAWVDVGRHDEYESLRVEFSEDRVTAIEALDK